MSDALYQPRFEFDTRLDSSLYLTYEQNECYALVVFENYVASIQLKLAELEDAVSDKDVSKIDLLAHAHISTYNYVGLSHIAEIMREIRHRVNTYDWDHVKHLTEQARVQTEGASPIISQELERLQLFIKNNQL